jgi:hypothetical protein
MEDCETKESEMLKTKFLKDVYVPDVTFIRAAKQVQELRETYVVSPHASFLYRKDLFRVFIEFIEFQINYNPNFNLKYISSESTISEFISFALRNSIIWKLSKYSNFLNEQKVQEELDKKNQEHRDSLPQELILGTFACEYSGGESDIIY